jgi:cytochrome d ubiquinol oxidase subunit II
VVPHLFTWSALLVFLLFVQGGQSMLFSIGRNETQQKNAYQLDRTQVGVHFHNTGHFRRRILRFLSLVLFHKFRRCLLGLDSDPALLRIQAVSYEYQAKKGNLLGKKTYQTISYDQWYR